MDRPAADPRLKFLLAFAAWSTLAFLPAWAVSHGWQRALAAVAGRVVAPRGSEVEFVDLQLFYPMDVAAFAALCLASGWETWAARARALVLGAPLMVLAELAALSAAMAALMAAGAGHGAGEAARLDSAVRLSDALIRATGLAFAAALWFVLLGRRTLAASRGAKRARAGQTIQLRAPSSASSWPSPQPA